MFTYLFYFFLAYLLYRLIFNFIIPIYRTTQQVKRGFHEMNERMNGRDNGYNASQNTSAQEKGSHLNKMGEYIDFEEVKD